jgi:hypothetical protein
MIPQHSIILADEDDLRMRLLDEAGMVLFEGYGDMLVTSHRGPIELRLNFGQPDRQEYVVLFRFGEDALLLQDAKKLSLGGEPLRPVVLPWSAIEELWRDLRYDPDELKDVPIAGTEEWLEAWIAGSPLEVGNSASLQSRLHAIRGEVLAEDPVGNPSVRHWLDLAIAAVVEVHGPVLRWSTETPLVTAFLNDSPEVLEWRAVAGFNRDLLMIGSRWLVRASGRG